MTRTRLPAAFQNWFARQGWTPHPHQLALLEARDAPATLLIAPTGGGKTLAGFLPTLVDLSGGAGPGMHTLYVSPLKALANDIARNLRHPADALGLKIRIEDRTGDTGQAQRKRQRVDPPHILLTTPESLALLLSYPEAPQIFAGLKRIVLDEIHALAESKRGDQLMLALSRLATLAPDAARVGLSATVEDPPALADFMAPGPPEGAGACRIIHADPGPAPDIAILDTAHPPPWSGMGGRYAVHEVMDAIAAARTTLVFINTRAQAELFFQALWQVNDANLPIGLHHGSLSRDARARVEAAMVAGDLRAVVCTGSLDLGIDWGNVDLVIQVGAPKNVKRLVQRIGRANHRYNAPSRALLVPANRFEVIECRAALDAVAARDLDGERRADGPLDVLCQHILLSACAAPFDADALFGEVRSAGPYRRLPRADYDRCLDYCATGGYALRAYDRWQRLMQRPDGLWQLRDPRRASMLRMNAGTIVDTETLKVRLRGGPGLGEVEESFVASLTPGDTFLIGGQVVRYDTLKEMTVMVSRSPSREPRIAVFQGTKLACSTRLSERYLELVNDAAARHRLPAHTRDWLDLQEDISALPAHDRLLVETFTRKNRSYLCLYGFAGKNAMQTLGLLLTRRMESLNLAPVGFVSNDYALLIWGLTEVADPAELLASGPLKQGWQDWLGENAVMKRTFRTVATIGGLLERNLPGQRKSGRQATFSSDILYDTLRRFDPDHLMMEITRREAMHGLVSFERIDEMLARTDGRIDHRRAPHVTPMAAPLLLEVGKVPIKGLAQDDALEEEAAQMMAEAGLDAP
ncbi:ligase-associated DNA damage response DEXH box helicase [Oceanomicrobium pacificus]|uniref:Ligase-associated DNA damage response DEXH box helicase n=1 Tax=Oceanomicrobium pacificus TaxID=2692916 RepID=A0A6B0TU76_9RHOB|nr:ligase-associated DNA damage response DEXH box helicase [Oceanomicrobium pacificus]MXU65325.1 ligase-associated DNA damage response DEXH box helicase [Oceanomicrobium pacificus]